MQGRSRSCCAPSRHRPRPRSRPPSHPGAPNIADLPLASRHSRRAARAGSSSSSTRRGRAWSSRRRVGAARPLPRRASSCTPPRGRVGRAGSGGQALLRVHLLLGLLWEPLGVVQGGPGWASPLRPDRWSLVTCVVIRIKNVAQGGCSKRRRGVAPDDRHLELDQLWSRGPRFSTGRHSMTAHGYPPVCLWFQGARGWSPRPRCRIAKKSSLGDMGRSRKQPPAAYCVRCYHTTAIRRSSTPTGPSLLVVVEGVRVVQVEF